MRAILIATVATLSLAALAGCGQKVERQGDKTVVTGMGGTTTTVVTGGDAAAAAAALPAYAPAYPGASIVASADTTVHDTRANILTLTTSDTPEQVVAFYKGKLAGSGMDRVTEMNVGLGRMLIAQDGAGKGVQIMAMKTGGQTRIQITQNAVGPKS